MALRGEWPEVLQRRCVVLLHICESASAIVRLVLSDECELVSVWHECGDIMQHKVDATRREQRCVEV